jgi:hypothetical protein
MKKKKKKKAKIYIYIYITKKNIHIYNKKRTKKCINIIHFY